MKVHNLKIDERWFSRLVQGEKTHEIRLNDRDFQTGDVLTFRVRSDSGPVGATVDEHESTNTFTITHVMPSDACKGLKEGFCVLSLKPNP